MQVKHYYNMDLEIEIHNNNDIGIEVKKKAAINIQFESKVGGSTITVDDALSTTSTNPVQNKVITEEFEKKADKVLSPTANNFASLDANGNLQDSGKKASDFAPTAGSASQPFAVGAPVGVNDAVPLSLLQIKEIVIAQSECTLEKRIASLERLFIQLCSGDVVAENIQTKQLGVWSKNNIVKVGSGAPTVPPDFAGQIYVDYTNNVAYKANGNESINNWSIL